MAVFPVNNDLVRTQVRVMLVDGTLDVRNFIAHLFNKTPGLILAACTSNIQESLEAAMKKTFDIILLDGGIPGAEGLSAAQLLNKTCPHARIILITGSAFQNMNTPGIADYIQKPGKMHDAENFGDVLVQKIIFLSGRNAGIGNPGTTNKPKTPKPEPTPAITLRKHQKFLKPSAIAIGSSTGGPEALVKLFKQLANQIKHTPVFITQHMPASFTSSFALHIQEVSGVTCIEPKDGALVEPGMIYLAPGDFHMEFKRQDKNKVTIALTKTPPENFCRPSVDPMLRSLVEVYGKHFLTIILTGMGHDGLAGCKAVAEAGGTILAQDQASSIVWGMPGSVATEGLCNAVLPLDNIAAYIRNVMGGNL